MLLKNLLDGTKVISCPKKIFDVDVKDIKIDQRQVEKGDVFIALQGTNFDGNDFVEKAIEKGACAVVSDRALPFDNAVRVENARSAYALMSKHYFEDACDDLRVIAITGTNGKTTTAKTISSVLQTAGARVGTIGTLGASYNGKNIDTGFTTPDPYMLHKLFAQMKKEGQEFVVMEASAHALALNKLDGIQFEIGVLTNITEDHLDFFGNMDCYAKAKQKLFERDRCKLGIVCGGKLFVDEVVRGSQVPMITYGINGDYDVQAKNIIKSFSSSKFDCDYLGQEMEIKTSLVGGYNIENALASIAVCRSLGVSEELVKLGMNCLPPVEGRFNVIKMGGLNIIIDFAHTPDGLEKVLSTARDLTDGKLVVVFGCGGNRDKQKRPIMGSIASSLTDEVVITSDNPRFERPIEIMHQIKEGVRGDCLMIPNRRMAIEQVLSTHNSGETVVIAGKGGEKFQSIMGQDIPYNDFDVVYNFYRNKIKAIKNEEKIEDFDENDI